MARKYKNSTKKALKARGGFQLPPSTFGGKRGLALGTERLVRNYIKNREKSGSSPLQAMKEVIGAEAAVAATKIAGTIYSKVTSPNNFQSDAGQDVVPSVASSSMKRLSGDRGIATGKLYKTFVQTGVPATKTVLAKGRTNGTSVSKAFDTLIDIPFADSGSGQRNTLTNNFGWNMKRQLLPKDNLGPWFVQDLVDYYPDLQNWTGSDSKNQSIYLDTHWFDYEIRFSNLNSYLATTIKVHLIKVKNDLPIDSSFLDGTTSSIGLATGNALAMPYYTQLAAPATAIGLSAVNVDPNSRGLFESSAIKDAWEKVSTYSRKISPGEIWNFTHRHHTGAGLRADVMVGEATGAIVANDTRPLSYFYLLEYVGPKVEICNTKRTDQCAIGTAPGKIHIEIRKKAKIGLEDSILDTVNQVNGGGSRTTKYGTRTFSKDITLNSVRVESVGYDNIVDEPAGTPSFNEYTIRLTTDANVRSAGASL